jgi:hypothetical protein
MAWQYSVINTGRQIMKFDLYPDAAGNRHLSCGAYTDGELTWPAFWSNGVFRGIILLELDPTLLAFYTWGSKRKGKKIILRCDKMSLVQILN